MIVADANLLIALLVPGKATASAVSALTLDSDWVGPPILRSELRNVLSTMTRLGVIDFDTALIAMEEAEELLEGNEIPVRSVDVLTLSKQSSCSAYDCEYVILARALRIPLVTWDREILAAFPGEAVDPDAFVRS